MRTACDRVVQRANGWRIPNATVCCRDDRHRGPLVTQYGGVPGRGAASDRHPVRQGRRGAFYKASWTVDSPLLQCVAAADGVVLGARGIPEAWRLTVLFEDRSSASSFQECCRTAGVPLAIRRLESVTEYFETSTETLTERQREALVLAYREGYFEEPRAASQAELAEELGISSSAFGRRLRRGIDSLIDDAVLA